MLSIKSIMWGVTDSLTSGREQLQQMARARNWPVIAVIEINIINNTISTVHTLNHEKYHQIFSMFLTSNSSSAKLFNSKSLVPDLSRLLSPLRRQMWVSLR